MKRMRTITEWGILGLTALALLSLDWSAHRPYTAPAAVASAATMEASASSQPQETEDFIDPKAFASRARAQTVFAEFRRESNSVVLGESVQLEPTTPLAIPATGRLEFVATLRNPQATDRRVIGELRVTKSDGTVEILLKPRAVTLRKQQALRIPAGFTAKRFPAGQTQFVAILRDMSGQEIDRASVTFTIEPAR